MRPNRRLLGLALAALCLAATAPRAAQADTLLAEMDGVTLATGGTLGFELDALPFASGGYYGSVWFGVAPWRVRGILAEVVIPRSVTQPQYAHHRIHAAALVADWFFGRGARTYAGPWIGAGVEQWESRIELRDGNDSATFSNSVATLGGGYVWKFLGNFYLNPWAGVHHHIGGEDSVRVGPRTYHPPPTNGEASVKLGWHF